MHDSVAMFSIRCMGTVEDVWRLRHLPMATFASHTILVAGSDAQMRTLMCKVARAFRCSCVTRVMVMCSVSYSDTIVCDALT